MRIIRPDLSGGEFVGILNATARDHRLSWRARGLLVELLSYPDGWETNVDKLVKVGRAAGDATEGRSALRAAMRELEEHGYVHHLRTPVERGRWITETHVFPVPTDVPVSGRRPTDPSADRTSADRAVGDPVVSKKTDTKTDTKTDRKDLEGSGQSSTASGRFAPSSGGEEDSFVEVDRETAPAKQLSQARANDREIFHSLVGDKIRSDGSKFTEGTFRWDQFYDTFRKWKRPEPIRWPGTFLRAIADSSYDDSPADWLLNYGLESA